MEMQNDYMNLRVGAGKFFYGHGCIRELATEVKRLGGKPLLLAPMGECICVSCPAGGMHPYFGRGRRQMP